MSYHLKFIVPLLDDEITIDDLTPEAGFVDAYTDDINRPYLDNHIFLLYIANLNSKPSYNRTMKFKNLKSLYNVVDVRIKGTLCKVYAFCITDPAIKYITKNLFALSDSDKLKILKFWKTTDDDVNEFFVKNIDIVNHSFNRTSVPEWDYEKLYVRIQKKGEPGT